MPDEKPTLVIGTRLGVLKSNLQLVREVLEATKRRGVEIEDIGKVLGEDGVAKKIDMIESRLGIAKLYFKGNESARGMEALDEATAVVEGIKEEFVRCGAALQRLGDRRVEFDPVVNRSLGLQLVDEAAKRAAEIESLEKRLSEVKDGDAGNLGKVWEEYNGVFKKKSQSLFGEYVDFLRGLALRESGLDDGICQLAQLLLQRLDNVSYGFEWSSLALPAHQGPTGSTSRFVRLGFPEWTIWALPLTAHNFGKILVSEHDDLAKMVDDLAKPLPADSTRDHLIDCLADAFATYSMGPAYGCAAVLMQLNPVPPEEGARVPDTDRAKMIFEIWRKADDKAKLDAFGTQLREDLEQAWATALDQASAGVPPKDEPDVSKWADLMWDWLEANAKFSVYEARNWVKNAHVWSQKLLDEEIEPKDKDVRDVLNAAWACRVSSPDRVDDIDRAAMRLLDRMFEKTRPKGGGEAAVPAGPSRPTQGSSRE